MRTTPLAALLCAVAPLAEAQELQRPDEKALVRLEVSDEAVHRACELRRKRAPVRALERVKIHQPYVMRTSGVVVSGDGEIVTSALHPKADLRVVVTFHDGRQERGTVVGTDPRTCLALVRVPAKTPDFLALNETAPEVRQPITLGGQSGDRALSVPGYVCREHVPVEMKDLFGINGGREFRVLGGAFLVAAPVARLNPGSACRDRDGRLLGLVIGNTPARVLRSTQPGGRPTVLEMNFVLPAARIARVVEDLRAHGKVVRAYYGVQLVPTKDAVRAHLKHLPASAVTVRSLAADGPASKGGLRENDIVVAVEGKRYPDAVGLGNALSDLPPGEPVRLTVLRGGETRVVTLRPTPWNR